MNHAARSAEAERWETEGFSTFSSARQDRTVAQFVASSERLRATLSTALPASLLGRRPFRPGHRLQRHRSEIDCAEARHASRGTGRGHRKHQR